MLKPRLATLLQCKEGWRALPPLAASWTALSLLHTNSHSSKPRKRTQKPACSQKPASQARAHLGAKSGRRLMAQLRWWNALACWPVVRCTRPRL